MNDPNATLSFVQAVKQVLNNYANFSGRARRSEYWYYALFSMIVAFIAQVLDLILGLNIEGIGYGYLYIICALALIVPSLSVSVLVCMILTRVVGTFYGVLYLLLEVFC